MKFFGNLRLRESHVTGHVAPFLTQPAITCSKITIETLEQGVKYVVNNKDTRTAPLSSFWYHYC